MDNAIQTAVLASMSAPRHNNYFYGKLMDVPHFQMEQNYFINQRWLLNRLSLGQGVLCGLGVVAQGAQICVSPGVAVDTQGREIVVPSATCLNPWQLTGPCGQPSTVLDNSVEHTVSICISFKECSTDLTPVLVTDCNTREQCYPGTIVETFCLCVREFSTRATVQPAPQPAANLTPPGAAQAVPAAVTTSPICAALQKGTNAADRKKLLCTALSGPCRPPAADSCLVLATVELMADGKIGAIDTCTYRQRVYSNTVLLDLILCLSDRIEQCCASAKPCKTGFPVTYIPFTSIATPAGPDSSGDFVVVGTMLSASWQQFQQLIVLPDFANQIYCDPVQLSTEAKQTYVAYVPSALERNGDFSQFKVPIKDPNTGVPFPSNMIPKSELPVGNTGVFAWRVRSIVP